MTASASEEVELTPSQELLLRTIYGSFASSGSWPTFQYVSATLVRHADDDPSRIYFELADLGLVTPRLTPREGSRVREETHVAVSIAGLAQLDEAAEDRDHFLVSVRYIAGRARRFWPDDPTTVEAVEVTREELAAVLRVPPDSLSVTRLLRLLEQASPLWNGFHELPSGSWSLTLRIDDARRFADVDSVGDFVSLAAAVPAQATDDGPPPAPLRSAAAESPAEQQPSDRDAAPLRFATNVASDLPAEVDLLGFRPLVRALLGLLNDRNTVLPIAIAITAPWGTGKSSVMRQLQMALEEAPDRSAPQRRWATVRFDAWKYERGERLWAALAKAIYSQPQYTMTRRQQLAFRARLERERRGWPATLGAVAWPCMVVAALVMAVVTLDPSGPGAIPGVIATAAVTLGGLSRYGKALANPFARAIERHANRPDYEAQLGFTADADRDIHKLTKLLAPDDDHGLAVFVDDLDRCSSAHLVEVVEAMNQIFNSARNHRCVFVLGLDREVVTTNLHVAYADTVARLREDGNKLGERFGLEFLAKLVQLSVSLPEPTSEALRRLIETATGGAAPRAAHDDAQLAADPEIARVQTDIQAASDETLAGVADAARRVTRDTTPRAVVAEATRRARAERIEDSPEVADAEFAALPLLERNARQVKRFHNAFRLQLYVANEDDTVHFRFSADELVALARWVVVRLRWPDLGNAIAQHPALLSLLESAANDEPSSVEPLPGEELIEARDEWLAEPGVCKVLVEANRARRLSALELKTFLRVA